MDGRTLLCCRGQNSSGWSVIQRGYSELSSQEVSAALRMINDEFSRELFCYVWWPGSASHNKRDIERMLLRQVLEQCKVRAIQALTTQLTHDIAELELTAFRHRSQSPASSLTSYRSAMEEAKEQRWPSPSSVYQRLTRGVLGELSTAVICSTCQGAGYQLVHERSGPCQKCQGSGRRPCSDLARAQTLGITWHAYAKAWKAPFEWALKLCEQAIQLASDVLCRNLGIAGERHKTAEVLS
ncbi:hypothetical protein C4K22_3407 [Pseudomonas chlororaphis subsp. aurantiaca]|nr:hypothetical protein [Pseudomonas chlororaphis]AZD22538.1 hypothetical protein C4K24_3235 [Pseudomonas chlororaphis subsp. aurantiaca]AZD36150.1 hypothetical protein C4K22_3407 [Pseudomonas chlororaphis subsp. aurantiaca]AZD42488.1 hypothetical protein C4K21_3414 [Pseudomonas chlororaphis subsp. aurantiaca]AZD48743.1 hypothetical protein C4K20_3328 [Pseudomonas chlororaphis subsp. aurantiaca]AZD67173.1 hypothetical protein C4K17_3287 [Pseudomonas chlororaphis subsp. aurantiaca]